MLLALRNALRRTGETIERSLRTIERVRTLERYRGNQTKAKLKGEEKREKKETEM